MKDEILTYIINLERREDRKEHIIREFESKSEFQIKLVKAIENPIGAVGLWQTIVHIIKNFAPSQSEYILICEDDHQFTKNYNKDEFFKCIIEAHKKEADVLLGGVSWLNDVLQVSETIFWLDQFTGTQFMIIFRKFYQVLIDTDFQDNDVADLKICSLSNDKLLCYPFISTQKEFGYSDITSKNTRKGYVSKLFEKSSLVLENLSKVSLYYGLNRHYKNG